MMACSCYSIHGLLHELLETGKVSPGEQLIAGPVLWTGLMGSIVFGFSITFPINSLPLLSSDHGPDIMQRVYMHYLKESSCSSES